MSLQFPYHHAQSHTQAAGAMLAVLTAIVISAVVGFLDVPDLLRIQAFRGESLVIALLALFSELLLNILPGLPITAGLANFRLRGRVS